MPPLRDFTLLVPSAQLDKAFYDRVRAARPRFKRVARIVVPPFEGRGMRVDRGQTVRVIEEEGVQIADISFWNAHNPRERLSGRTWELEGWFVQVYTRLWSNIPWLRPIATCIDETVDSRLPESGFHHHWVATGSCATEWSEMRVGIPGLNSCHVNFVQAIEPLGLKEEDIQDVVGLFQKMRLDPRDGKFYAARSDSQKGDYIEFYAEVDLIVAVTFCPNGDNTRYYSLPGRDDVFPIGVEIYDTGIQPREFPVWTDWRPGWKGKWEPSQTMGAAEKKR